MIRREENGSTWLIHQTAHAYIAGQIAEHWVGTHRAFHEPRQELWLAATTHDAGWTAAEQCPRINGQGKPRSFTEMDRDEHFTIWQNSIQATYTQNRYAGLLTSKHCSELYEQRLLYIDDPAETKARIKEFLIERHAWEKSLITSLREHPRYGPAVAPERLAENLRLLQVWDYLSLLLCMSTVRENVIEDVPLRSGQRDVLYVAGSGARGMVLEPFPLDQPLTIWIDARQLTRSQFESDDDLRAALAEAPYKPLAFELGPL